MIHLCLFLLITTQLHVFRTPSSAFRDAK